MSMWKQLLTMFKKHYCKKKQAGQSHNMQMVTMFATRGTEG